jgi:hypothetical protein
MGCGHKDFDIVLRSNDVLTAVWNFLDPLKPRGNCMYHLL